VGLNVTFVQVCLFLPMVLALLILQISMNGHGFREFLLLGMFGGLGVSPMPGKSLIQEILALSILGLSSDFLVGATGGFILFFNAFRRSKKSVSTA